LRETADGDAAGLLVSAGYSDDEGGYVKTKKYYDLEANNYGIVYRDYMTRKGLGLGVREHYYLSGAKEEDLYIYGTKGVSESVASIKGEYRLSDPNTYSLFSLTREHNDGDVSGDRLYSFWNYSNAGRDNQTNMYLYYSEDTKLGNNYLSGQLSEYLRLSDHLRSDMHFNFYYTDSSYDEARFDRNYSISLEYAKDNYSAQLYGYEALSGNDYLPKLTLKSSLNTPVQFEVTTAHIVSNETNFSIQQSDFKANYLSQPSRIHESAYVTYNVSYLRSMFSTSDMYEKWSANTSILANITPKAYIGTRLNVERNMGYDPVQVTHGIDYTSLDWDANWQLNQDYRIILSGGYDFEQELYNATEVKVMGTSYPFWSWTLAAKYDFNTNTHQSTGLYLTLNPQTGITGYVDINYDQQLGELTNFVTRLEFPIKNNWDITAAMQYNTYDRSFNVSELKAVRALHCREWTISLYPQAKKYFMYYTLKNSGSG
jgi:hypothetical protein